jgi:hypothetical protein
LDVEGRKTGREDNLSGTQGLRFGTGLVPAFLISTFGGLSGEAEFMWKAGKQEEEVIYLELRDSGNWSGPFLIS